MSGHSIFELGDLNLQCGLRLRGARMAYKTYGSLNEGKDNVIVFLPSLRPSTRPTSR